MDISKRSSNIELLRIVAMIMIIAHHFASHGGLIYPTDYLGKEKLWVDLLKIGGAIGNNIFILIAGYFTINNESFNYKRLIKLWAQLLTYSLLIYFIMIVCNLEFFSLVGLIHRLLPITFNEWWFASTYFILCLFTPFLSEYLRSISQVKYKKFLLIMIILWVLLPTLTGERESSNYLIWFLFMYSIGGYIRLYSSKTSFKHSLSIFIISILITYISMIIFTAISPFNWWFADNMYYFYDYQRITTLISSVFLFISFLQIKINSKSINLIASTCFGIYLIHDDRYIRQILWNGIFNVSKHTYGFSIIPYSIFVIVAVFSVSSIIEFFRLYFIKSMYKVSEKR